MRYLFILSLLFLYSNAPAQDKWYLSSGVGVTFSDLSRFPGPYSGLEEPTVIIDVKGWRQLGKHWSVGAAVETGALRARLNYVSVIYNGLGNATESDVYGYNTAVFSAYVAPQVFAHYRLNFGNSGGYFYGGPSAGVITGNSNEIQLSKNLVAPLVGAGLGVALPIGEHAKVMISHSWRWASMNLEQTSYARANTFNGGYYEYYYQDRNVHYFHTMLSIVAGL